MTSCVKNSELLRRFQTLLILLIVEYARDRMKNRLPVLPTHLFKQKKGFTLIEILVVIAIIAILSTVGISVYTQTQRLARDAKRKSDLKQIENALVLYYQDFKTYPSSIAPACANSWCLSNRSAPWIQGLPTAYIDALPVDPTPNGGNPWEASGYEYGYASTAGCPQGAYYILVTQLENKDDPDNIANRQTKWCDGQLLTALTWSGSSYVIASFK